MAADNHAHDLPEGDLDGVGVLEHGQNKLACDVMDGVAQVNSGHAPATMEVAIFAVAHGGEPHVGRAPSPPNIIRRCADSRGYDNGKRPRWMLHLDLSFPIRVRPP